LQKNSKVIKNILVGDPTRSEAERKKCPGRIDDEQFLQVLVEHSVVFYFLVESKMAG